MTFLRQWGLLFHHTIKSVVNRCFTQACRVKRRSVLLIAAECLKPQCAPACAGSRHDMTHRQCLRLVVAARLGAAAAAASRPWGDRPLWDADKAVRRCFRKACTPSWRADDIWRTGGRSLRHPLASQSQLPDNRAISRASRWAHHCLRSGARR